MNRLLIFILASAISLLSALVIAQEDQSFDSGASVNMQNPSETNATPLGSVSADNENIGNYIIDWILRGASFTSPEATLFGAISMILNSVVLAFALVVLMKHGLQFATLTASKGVPGGSQLSGGVITVRSSLAIGLLSPIIANGFSPVQVGIQEATRFGAYIGDEAVRASTQYLSGNSAGDTSHTTVPVHLSGISSVVWQVVLNETCQQAVDMRYKLDQAAGSREHGTSAIFTVRASNDEIKYLWGYEPPTRTSSSISIADSLLNEDSKKESACGGVIASIPEEIEGSVMANGTALEITASSEEERLYKKQLETNHNALIELRADLKPVVSKIFMDQQMIQDVTAMRYAEGSTVAEVEAVYQTINNLAADVSVKMPSYGQALLVADQKYKSRLVAQGRAAAKYIVENSPKDEKGRTWDEALVDQGFAALGSYYWVQLKTNMEVASLQKHLVSVDDELMPDPFNTNYREGVNGIVDQVKSSDNFTVLIHRLTLLEQAYKTLRPNQEIVMNFNASEQVDDIADATYTSSYGDDWWEKITEHLDINWAGNTILKIIQSQLIESTNNDLIVNLANIGITITSLMEIMWPVLMGLVVAKGVTSSGVGSVVGFFTSGVVQAAVSILTPVVVMGSLVGLTFHYLLPSIPMIKWLISLQSWGIMMFIAMIYGPIWMMSTAAASNEDWINDKTRDGFIVLAELILRPLLMVLGFYAAMTLMAVANIGARMAFSYFMGIANEGFLGVIGIFAVVILSGFVAYKLIMRTFDLIYELPDFIIEKMGGRPLGDAAKDDTPGGINAVVGNIHRGHIDATKGMNRSTSTQ